MNTVSKRHIIVAVGASAGGLDALNRFFDNVEVDVDFSFVIIQHLSPDHKSHMAELLGKKTNVPIIAVTDDSEIKRNHIYVIPPSMNLVIEEGHLRLLDKPKTQKLNLPIDLFMSSLAGAYKECAAAIILSGTGSDGSRGVQEIKKHGGVVLVQQPDQADFDGMPLSAIHTGVADFIIPAEEMMLEIKRYFDQDVSAQFQDELSEEEEEDLKDILQMLHKNTTINFDYYKRPTILRRTERRIKQLRINSFTEYLAYLKIHPEEIDVLYQEFLIGVTKFFRDTRAWETLNSQALHRIVEDKKDGDILKVWDVACSTGEEAYSLAMSIDNQVKKSGKDIQIKVFATDISEEHIKIASKGLYDENQLVDISEEYHQNYFTEITEGFVIKDDLRKKIIFSRHDILKDPPFKNMDLVVCRNLLIYLKPEIQTAVLQTLHYSLKLSGYMFLGTSESNTVLKSYFETISSKWKIYENIRTSDRLHTELLSNTRDKGALTLSRKRTNPPNKRFNRFTDDVQAKIGETVLQMFDSAGVYIDSDFQILDAMGSFSKYAQLPEKGFSLDLIKMLPDSLTNSVSGALRKARRHGKDFIYKDVVTAKDGVETVVDVLVRPIKVSDADDYNYVVTFVEQKLNPDEKVRIEQSLSTVSEDHRLRDLLEEIEETRGELKKALEGSETSNEELQTLNEELLASNEELQSTNEELQSVNEELHTVNVEHIKKMDDLALLNADMDNLLNSTEIATIFLDRDLKIRKFTPSIQEHFQLMEQDVGRPISHFLNEFGSGKKTKLVQRIEKVMEEGKVTETRLTSKTGKHYIRRIAPFYTSKKEIEGVVLTFLEISRVVESQEKLLKSEVKFKEFYEEDPVMHVSINPVNGLIVECNKTFVDTLKFNDKADVLGKRIIQFYDKPSKIKAVDLLELIQREKKISAEEMTIIASDGTPIPVILSSELVEREGDEPYTRSTLVDVSELKSVQRRVIDKNDELRRINKDLEQFVSICSHDLQEPLGTIRFSSDVILKKFEEGLDPKAKEYLGYIYGAAGRMADQIKGLLEHSRIGQEVERTKVDIAELLEVVKYDLGKRLKECGGQVHIGKMPVLEVYKTEFRLLFQNLIGNSLKYCKEGVSPEIRVASYEDGAYYVFSVSDNGIGIAEEDLTSIFTIFGRASSQDKYEGTGVGLAHCEKIVQLHDGNIWVDSQQGVGSTFYFKIKI